MKNLILVISLVVVITSCNNKKTDNTATAETTNETTEVAMQEATENLHQFKVKTLADDNFDFASLSQKVLNSR